MKLHFEPNLDFQLRAIEAVCDLFGGQKVCRTEFTVTRDSAEPQALLDACLQAGISKSTFQLWKQKGAAGHQQVRAGHVWVVDTPGASFQ